MKLLKIRFYIYVVKMGNTLLKNQNSIARSGYTRDSEDRGEQVIKEGEKLIEALQEKEREEECK